MKNILKLTIILIIIVIVAVCIYFGINKSNSLDVTANRVIEYNFYKYYNGEKFGVIDKNGNILIEANYQDIVIPNPKHAIIFLLENDEIKKVVNENNEEIFTQYEKVLPIAVTGLVGEIPYEKSVLIYEENGKQGLIDINGKKLTKAQFNSIESLPYKEGEILAKTDNNIYVLKENGKEKVKLENDIEIIADGYYNEENAEKSGYIISKPTSDGMMYGYINYKGKKILDTEYDKIERIMSEDNYLIVKKNGKYGLYKNNDVIINCNYQDMTYRENSNLYFVRRGTSNGVLDEKGNIIVPVEYQDVQEKGIFIEAITKDNKKECYNISGEKTNQFDEYQLIEKSKYDNTYIGISNDYTYKILDNNYNSLTTENYEYIENILKGLYIVRNSIGKYGVINDKNIKLIDTKYDIIQLINSTEVIQVIDVQNNIISLYNKNGNKIFEEKDAFVMLANNYIKVFCDEGVKYFTIQGEEISNKEIYKNNNIIGFYENGNGKWGFKDKNNNIVVEAKYDRIVDLNENGYGGIKLDDKWGIIDQNGNVIVEPKFDIDDNISDPEFLNKFYKSYYASVGAFYIE